LIRKQPTKHTACIPNPRIGGYLFVTIAEGRLKTKPINPSFNQPANERFRLKIIDPIANLSINDTTIVPGFRE
jgi:hypothetical protein